MATKVSPMSIPTPMSPHVEAAPMPIQNCRTNASAAP
ncbi:MAG: hypothetical protein BWY91_02801 [bacterium ADurb.BinA028]|nr:MAG: hypothetical protein BWY91_02801 [bacterium ADurb.BinA028]